MANTRTVRKRGRGTGDGSIGARRARGVVAAGALVGAAFSAGVLTVGSAAPAGASGTRSHAQTIHLSTAKVAHVGTVLTTGTGLTLYHFDKDPAGKATCTGGCAKIWPPFLAAKGDHVKGPKGVKGLSVIKVSGGHWQVAFHNVALYRFEADSKKGQAKGQGIAGSWFAVLKSRIPVNPAPATSPATPTTRPAAPTTQAPPATSTPAAPAPGPSSPVTAPPTTTPPTAPPAPTTTTQPPTTTTTMGGGGYGY